MSVTQALVLGIIQGLTEFLPISSSGHLVLLEEFWKIPLSAKELQGFDVILHTGTLGALLLCYWKTWLKLLQSFIKPGNAYRALLLALIVATIPAIFAGVLVQDLIADTFRTPQLIGWAFIATALVLILGERFPEKHRALELPRMRALWIGCAQVLALIPGISRSGFTISAGRAAGLSRREALDFSFLMATPVIAGATMLTVVKSVNRSMIPLPFGTISIGFFSSFFVSMLAIVFLRKWVATQSLAWFAIYLVPVGILLVL